MRSEFFFCCVRGEVVSLLSAFTLRADEPWLSRVSGRGRFGEEQLADERRQADEQRPSALRGSASTAENGRDELAPRQKYWASEEELILAAAEEKLQLVGQRKTTKLKC